MYFSIALEKTKCIWKYLKSKLNFRWLLFLISLPLVRIIYFLVCVVWVVHVVGLVRNEWGQIQRRILSWLDWVVVRNKSLCRKWICFSHWDVCHVSVNSCRVLSISKRNLRQSLYFKLGHLVSHLLREVFGVPVVWLWSIHLHDDSGHLAMNNQMNFSGRSMFSAAVLKQKVEDKIPGCNFSNRRVVV